MLLRNKLRKSPKYSSLFEHKVPENEKNFYKNDRVAEILKSLGGFGYGLNADAPSDNQLEIRVPMVLENKVKYEGQWLRGTEIRAGKGK